MTLKVGTGDVVSAEAVGEMQLCFRDRYNLLKDVLYVPRMKRNLISISRLMEQNYNVSFEINKVFIFKRNFHVCSAKLETICMC